ncbi:MAG: hypothetical protein LBI81_01585 [Puniceicoccales bacterium]|nr:hypothetical protein [Puniceicoccales bacterium]
MKNIASIGLLFGILFAGSDAYAIQRLAEKNLIDERTHPPRVVFNAESGSKSFRSLSKRFESRDAKLLPQKNFSKRTRTRDQLSMQKFNRYQYRRSHSIRPSVPAVKPGGEK